MTDKTPKRNDNQSKDEKDIRKDNESHEIKRNVDELRDADDLTGWLDEKQSKRKPDNRRRTTLVDSNIPNELRDIIGKGRWVEAPTPEQIKQIHPTVVKNIIDLVSSLSSFQSTTPSSPASPSAPSSPSSISSASPHATPSSDGSRQLVLTPEIQQRISDTRRLLLGSILAEVEEHQLKFVLIIIFFIIILLHLAVSLLFNN